MRSALLIVLVVVAVVAGCGSPKPRPAPPVPIENSTRGCADAAAGLERATKNIRPPEESVLSPMQRHCIDDRWPTVAIDCFATMTSDDLGKCSVLLATSQREGMFGVLGGTAPDRASLAVAAAKLSTLKVGIAECDAFVTAVAAVLACERMPLDVRLQLGNETADFWSLPTSGLPVDAQRKMAAACTRSLEALQSQATDAGCTP